MTQRASPARLPLVLQLARWSPEIGKETCLPAQPASPFPTLAPALAPPLIDGQTMAIGIQHMIYDKFILSLIEIARKPGVCAKIVLAAGLGLNTPFQRFTAVLRGAGPIPALEGYN